MPIINDDLKHDNCKDCIKNCEHAGTDREFVCSNGVSCKKTAPTKELKLLYAFAERLKSKKHCTFGESPFEDDCKEYVLIADINETLKELDKK